MALPGDTTSMGGDPRPFPTTVWSSLIQARDPGLPEYRHALDDLCQRYWKPVYGYIRASRSYSNEETKDLTQEFFIEVIEGNLARRFSADRGSFRAYLKGALILFLREQHAKATTQKRGGGRKILHMGEDELRGMCPDAGAGPEEEFERQWARAVLDQSVADLKMELEREAKSTYFHAFQRYDLDPSPDEPCSYADLARELGVQESDVHNYLHHCRGRLRTLVLQRIREYVGTEGEVESEVRRIFEILTGGACPPAP